MEKVATDIYTFSELRGKGFTYVDKTDILLTMAGGDWGKLFFMARPRRFGKSLAISTLKALFEGRRELFGGLAIEPKWDWSRKWPVLHLDMGSMQAQSVDEFRGLLLAQLRSRAAELGVERPEGEIPSLALTNLINLLAGTSPDGQVVVLIDEYDKPLLGHLTRHDVTGFRDELKAFYSVVKTMEAKQRFTFITGVSKFSKVSIFSDLNNLNDWTMHSRTATLFGYTHDEVRKYFPGRIHALAQANGISVDEAFDGIIKWYDGYRFEENSDPVINPVSLGCCLNTNKFANYWSKTAVPTFLIEILKRQPLNFSRVNVDESELEMYEPEKPRLVTLLYQTGYLTIKGFKQLGAIRRYALGFPNSEVENSFLTLLLPSYINKSLDYSSSAQASAVESLFMHDVPGFMKALKAFFADIPYDMTDRQNEQMWQAIVYVVLRSIGVNVNGEVRTHDGRIDMVVDLPGDIYIIEFKLDRPASETMEQIKGKDYAAKYALSKKRLTLIAISFSAAKRTIVDDLVEELAP